jgi:SNF2 family DNA or RNA helicase
MQRMVELVDELRGNGHRALIFSQFTSHLALAREALDAAGITQLYLDGATSTRARAQLIERFQAGEGDVFLISLKAGGTGINLTAADYVIHLDPWWNPAVEDQATDRAHRIGQTKSVTVYRLVSRGTVEEKILAMHGDKRALVAGVLDGTSAAGKLTTRDLLALVGDGPIVATSPRDADDLVN